MRGGGRWNRMERNESDGKTGLVGGSQSGCEAGSRHHKFAQALRASKTRSRISLRYESNRSNSKSRETQIASWRSALTTSLGP